MNKNSPIDYSPVMIDKKEVVIPLNDNTSSYLNLRAGTLTGLEMPAGIDGDTISFQVSNDGQTFKDLYDESGNEVFVNVGTDRIIKLNPADFLCAKFVRICSGTSMNLTNQTAERVIGLIMRVFK